MILFFVLLLWGFVAGRPGGVYPVHRQDFVWNEQPTPIPYQSYASRHDGVYRVDRQEFGGARQHYPFNNDFRTSPQTDYNGNQYWYPHAGGVDYRGYQPNTVLSSSVVGNAYVPKLFVPAADQVFGYTIPVSSLPNLPPATRQPTLPTFAQGTNEDDDILPPIPKSPVDEGEPLSALSGHSKRTTGRPIKYSPIDDEVEINAEQIDLLNSYNSARKPERKSQPTSRIRRHLYSSYPRHIDAYPWQPRIHANVYDPVEGFRVRVEPDYPIRRPFSDVEDIPEIFANFALRRPLDMVEDNEITDNVVAWEFPEKPASTSEAYSNYQLYHLYDLEDSPRAPFYPRGAEAYKLPNDVVVVLEFPQEPVASTSEIPTTVNQLLSDDFNDDDDDLANLREDDASVTSAIVSDENSDSKVIACKYAESETETVVEAISDITTTEREELADTESVLADSSDYMSVIFGMLKMAGPATDETEFDHEQEMKTIDSVENRPSEWMHEKSSPPAEDYALQFQNSASGTQDESGLAVSDPDALWQLLSSSSATLETKTELSDGDVELLKFILRQLDHNMNDSSTATETLTTGETTVESVSRHDARNDESSPPEIAGTAESVWEATTTDLLSSVEDELEKLELENALYLANRVIRTTSETSTAAESVEEEQFKESEEAMKNVDDQRPLSDEDSKDKLKKLKLKTSLYLANRETTTTSETFKVAESVEEKYLGDSREMSKNAVDEDPQWSTLPSVLVTETSVKTDDVSLEDNLETLMLNIVRQEPKVSFWNVDESE